MGTRQAMRKFKEARGLRQFTFGKAKSGGRNSSGRITIFHRGGGAKRLQRIVDLKRRTPSVGIVERVEYDPNRSSWIAPVRWIEGVENTVDKFVPPQKSIDPNTIKMRGRFWYSFFSPNVHQRNVAPLSSGLMGSPISTTASSKGNGRGSKTTCVKDRRVGLWASIPSFLSRVDRIKPRAAVSWHSFIKRRNNFGVVGGGKKTKYKPRTDRSLPAKSKDGACKVPVTYILASHKLEAGQMVVNYKGSKPSTGDSLLSGQNSSSHQDFVQTEKNG